MRRPLVLALALVLTAAVGASAATGTPIPWPKLRNPILQAADRALKDPAIVRANGRWWALFSAVDHTGSWRIGTASSRDFRHWTIGADMPHDPTIGGEASPDVVRAPDGGFVVTYQSFVHDAGGAQAKLYYRTTDDFRTFSPPHPLAHELHPGVTERMIDAALVWSPAGLLLGYKTGTPDGVQQFEIARSAGGTLDGPWTPVGAPDISVFTNTIENFQFLHLNGHWMLLATTNSFDKPYLLTVRGDPTDPGSWLHWSKGRLLDVPQEAWNPGRGSTGVTFEHANCAFVIDGRRIGAYYYLVFADAPELTEFGSAGHDVLAVARSRDLTHWTVPPH